MKEEEKDGKMNMYFFKKGLRLVKTYQHEFIAYGKKRWVDREILEIFAKEYYDKKDRCSVNIFGLYMISLFRYFFLSFFIDIFRFLSIFLFLQ